MTTDIGRITVPVSDAIGSLTATITVRGLKTFSVRCRVGLVLLRFAAWVLPFKTDVELSR